MASLRLWSNKWKRKKVQIDVHWLQPLQVFSCVRLIELMRHSAFNRSVEEADYQNTSELFGIKSRGGVSLNDFIPKSEDDILEYAEMISRKIRPFEVQKLSSLLESTFEVQYMCNLSTATFSTHIFRNSVFLGSDEYEVHDSLFVIIYIYSRNWPDHNIRFSLNII